MTGLRVVCEAADAGERADVVLGRRLPQVSRRAARQLGLRGRLFVDGRPSAPSVRVEAGTVLELRWAAHAPAPPIRILAITPRMVYVDKPSGLHTHRLRPDDPPAVADVVAARVPGCAGASEDPREAGVVHRLDEGTSGVLAFARDRDAWVRAREAFSRRHVGKLYVAAVHAKPRTPWPPDGFDPAPPPSADVPSTIGAGVRIDAPLGDGPDRRVVVRDDGRAACTDVWCLRLHRRCGVDARAFVLVSLASGHRHQARVHLASIGWPIVGDLRYGIGGRSRLMLHAARLDLGAAIVGEPTVVAPWPAPVHAAWARLGRGNAPGFLRIGSD